LRLVEVERGVFSQFIAFNGDDTVDGSYRALDRSIRLKSDRVGKQLWLHELGHHVWFYLASSSQRLSFDNVHEVTLLNRTDLHFPSEYAGKNSREDFAESFSIYAGSLNGALKLDASRRFLVENVIRRIDPDCPAQVAQVGNVTFSSYALCVYGDGV
jgi:hypothetical protein